MSKKKKVLPKKHQRENNKLLVILFALLGFVLVLVYLSMDSHKSKVYSREEIISVVNSSMVRIPDTSFAVKLENGKAEFSDDNMQGNVMISEPYYSVKVGDGHDSFATMSYSTNDSGDLVSVAIFHIKKDKAIYKGSYLLGENVIVNSISTSVEPREDGYSIEVEYLEKSLEEEIVESDSIESETLILLIKDHMIVTSETDSGE